MNTLRSLLFAPAVRPDRFARAAASRADAVCIDLEDATPPAAKDEARRHAADYLAGPRASKVRVGVRINALDSPWVEADLAATAATADFVIVPKATQPDEIARLGERLGVGLWPLVETPEGVRRCWEIAAAPGVEGVMFGAFDYAAAVGCELAWEPLLFARGQLAAACARAQVQLLDAPSGDIHDTAALAVSTHRAKAFGFTGRACIHPVQVPVVNEVFTPTPDELEEAWAVLAAFEAAGGGAAELDGRLIELPVALAARRVVARAGG